MAAALDLDTALMLRVRDGDVSSFDHLLDRQRLPVIYFLYRMVQNQAIAEELAQEVFLRVYRARETYEPTAKLTTWLFRIATRLALNSIRDRRPESAQQSLDAQRADEPAREITDRQPTMENHLVNEAKRLEVRRAIAGLPEKQRAAVLMHKYQEMEYSQISKALGISESAVKSLLFRAYENLRAKLAGLA